MVVPVRDSFPYFTVPLTDTDGDCIRLKQLAVDGSDLLALGIARGPALGETLNRLFTLVLEHPEWNQREILLKKAGGCRPSSESDPARGESPEGKQ